MFIGFDRHATSEHLLSAVIEQLCVAGNTVHILQKDTGGDLPPIPERLSGYPVTTDVVSYKEAAKGNFAARYLEELKYVRNCKKYITSDYDAVFIQSNTVAGPAVKAIRKKLPKAVVTFNVQDIFPYNAVFGGKLRKNGLAFKYLAAMQRKGYKLSDHVITISEDMKDTLVSDGTPARKVAVVYNWSYRDELYENLDLTPVRQMFHSEYFNVVYAGNIGVMQNVDLLIEAAARMKEDSSVWFHIIGNGLYKEKLEARARDYGITNLSFWPMQPSETAPLIYSAADVNVIPLVKDVYKTALPSKTATCLACQKPIIFAIGKESRFGRKAMSEAGCMVVEADDAEELVRAIRDAREKVREEKYTDRMGVFFQKEFGRTENSRRYAEIITRNDKNR